MYLYAVSGSKDSRCLQALRSPDMTPMDYFLQGYIKSQKSQLYVYNYENVSDLKYAIISAFQEVPNGMVTLTMEYFGRRLEIVLRRKGGRFEKCNRKLLVYSIYIKMLMLSVYFQP